MLGGESKEADAREWFDTVNGLKEIEGVAMSCVP